jgi:ABC-type sugar transport system ATPase subunit
MIYVTHDQEEALSIADRVVVLIIALSYKGLIAIHLDGRIGGADYNVV